MNNIKKVKILFEYLSELSMLRNKTVTDVKAQKWSLFFDDIPNDEKNIKVYSRDVYEDTESDSSVLLSVKKPNFQNCPNPQQAVLKWLKKDWEDFNNQDFIYQKLETDSEENINNSEENNTSREKVNYEYLEESKDKKKVEEWILQRSEWAKEQKRIKRTRDFFSKLYIAYNLIERESETYEFVVGNGIIEDVNNRNISHPILLKRVKFEFDSNKNIIKVSDTDADSTLYTSLLKDIESINHSRLQNLQQTLSENFFHPLDNHDGKDYLKQLTNQLSDKSKFLEKASENVGFGDLISVRIKPVFLIRKRLDGTPEMIQDIRNDLDNKGHIEGYFSDLVGGQKIEEKKDKEYKELSIDDRLAATSGENINILLSKEANREQLEIAERIENNNAVVVQGPPGTGKTHTIANLLGHFLAQGKTVLVTSHTKKALSVLKKHVPKPIQDLCVSVLGDSNEDMVSSVNGITSRISKDTSIGLEQKIEITSEERKEIIKDLASVRRKIYRIKNKEFEPIVYSGNSFSPAEAAKFVSENKKSLNYIPGIVELNNELPLTLEELGDLYQSNASLSSSEEKELLFSIPDPQKILSLKQFEKQILVEEQSKDEVKEIQKELGFKMRFDFLNNSILKVQESSHKQVSIINNPFYPSVEKLESYIKKFDKMDEWMIQAAISGRKGGGHREKWEILIDSIEKTYSFSESIITQMLGYEVEFNEKIDLFDLDMNVNKLYELYKNKGKISKLTLLFNKDLVNTLNIIKINNKEISSKKDCELVLQKIKLMQLSEETEKLWNQLMSSKDTPVYADLGDKPWEMAKRRVKNIKKYLNWFDNEYKKLIDILNELEINQRQLFEFDEFDDDFTIVHKMLRKINTVLPYYAKLAKIYLNLQEIKLLQQGSIELLTKGRRKESKICIKAKEAIDLKDKDLYQKYLNEISSLYNKYSVQEKREKLLKKLKNIAPDWALAISERQGIHGETSFPENIKAAWKWKQFKAIIDELIEEPLEVLQKRSLDLSKQLREKTEELAADKAWYHLILRTEKDVSLKQNLTGWKITVKKIGKGYGKRAAMFKKEARHKMEKSQKAVPAWIMPMSKVFESFKVPDNLFDVIIIDEASQSDLTALTALYLAKKVIVVGDDKQVSPMAVGASTTKIDNLRDGFIRKKIPNWDLYDATTSIYDIAGTTFNPIMLKEHFRCVPDIIGYSNRLSYDYEIKPLRDAKSSDISPAVVAHRTRNGQRDPKRKINENEANEIVALIKSCIEQPEYDNQTFGVISLLGSEQADLIYSKIIEEIPMSVITEREILCGDASHFQGDERDVIFISLVDSSKEEGPLRLRGVGSQNSTKQRYNVAASRAKNQLWVVHSLDPSRDLKAGDMRKSLIEYAQNPEEYRKIEETIAEKSDSPFEEEVAKKLISAGYNIFQQWPVGSYSLDMVAQYQEEKVAIECDGERWHSGAEKVREDMERQTILERLGWRFIRLRGSEYYLDKEAAISRVISDLRDFGIEPESMIQKGQTKGSELLSKVKIRANQFLGKNNSDEFDISTNFVKSLNEKQKSSNGHNNAVEKKENLKLIKDNKIKKNNVIKEEVNTENSKEYYTDGINSQDIEMSRKQMSKNKSFVPIDFYALDKKQEIAKKEARVSKEIKKEENHLKDNEFKKSKKRNENKITANEYIELPSFFDIDLIDCDEIKDFFNAYDIDSESKIDMSKLREFYKSNRNKGYRLISEFKMRGIQFVTNKKSNFLSNIPNKSIKNIKLVYTDENTGKHENINKDLFREFFEDKEVNSDYYYNLIPLYIFREKEKLAEQEFIRNGYQIIDSKEIKKKQSLPKKQKSSDKIKKINQKISNFGDKNKENNLETDNFKEFQDKLDIEYSFVRDNLLKFIDINKILNNNDIKDIKVKKYFKKNCINNLYDLINFDIGSINSIKGIGSSYLKDFRKRFESVKLKENNKINKPFLLYTLQKETNINVLFNNNSSSDEKVIKFLREENIKTISDLTRYDIKKLNLINGVGDKSINEFSINVYKNILELNKVVAELVDYKIPETFANKRISALSEAIQNEKFSSISNKTVAEIGPKFNNKYNRKLYESFIKVKYYIFLYYDLDRIIKKAENNKISERNRKIINERLINESTLEVVGKKSGVTRERVRQIVANYTKNINKKLIELNFFETLKLNFNKDNFIKLEDLRELLSETSLYIVGLIRSNEIDGLYYIEFLNRIYFKEKFDFKLEKKIKKEISKLPQIGLVEDNLREIYKEIGKLYGSLNSYEEIKILKEFGVNIHKEFYTFGISKKHYINKIEILFFYKIDKPFRINEKNIKMLSALYQETFGESSGERSLRSWEGMVSRVRGMYLVGPRTYLNKRHQKVSIPTKRFIDNKLKEYLNKHKIMTAAHLYELIENNNENSGFLSIHHVYSFVKDVYSEIVDTPRGNLLEFYLKGERQLTREEQLINELKKNNGVMYLDKIKSTFKWSDLTIDNAIINSSQIIKLGSDRVIIYEDVFKDDLKESLKKIIEKNLEKGYCSVNEIYSDALFDVRLNQFFNNYSLKKPFDLLTIIKAVDEKVFGHTVFLYNDNQNIKSIEDYLYSLAKPYLYREEAQNQILKYGFAPSQVNLSLRKLIENNRLIQISSNKYIKSETFEIDKEIIAEVFASLDNQRNFIVPNEIAEKIGNKESNGIIINQYAIQQLLIKKGYKTLNRYGVSYNNEIIVMVKSTSNYNSIDEFVHFILKSDYNGPLVESNVFDFLVNLGIYKKNRSSRKKVLFQDMFENELIKVDLAGRVKLT